jgi:hypothetical protein
MLYAGENVYATYYCATYKNQCEDFARTGFMAQEPLGDDCEAGFVSWLPPFEEGLPECPACGGPSGVVGLLEPTEH